MIFSCNHNEKYKAFLKKRKDRMTLSKTKNEGRKAVQPPRDKYWGYFTGHALSLKAGRLNYMYTCMKQYGDFMQMYLGRKRRTVLVNDPEGIRYVLLDNAKNYPKNTPGYQLVSEVLGMGVFTDVGEDWKQGRRVIQPTFNPGKFDRYFKIVNEETKATLSQMKVEAKGTKLNMSSISTSYALHVIGRSLFDENLEESFATISKNLSHLIDLIEKKMTYITPFKTPAKKKLIRDFDSTLAQLDGEIKKIVDREKKKEMNPQENMIHALLVSPMKFSDEKIFSQVKTMIFAGHETTANVIMWTFYFLAKYPKYQERIFNEADTKDFLFQNEAELNAFSELDRFIKEVMRMRPPAWSFGRLALAEDKIHGEEIKAGDLISLSPYLIHHHPDYWDRPEEFMPERFLKEPVNYTYIPFGLGPRICMGERLANMEMRVFMLNAIRLFKFELSEESKNIQMNPQVSLRPDKEIILNVQTR
jgi:cytochrome P450